MIIKELELGTRIFIPNHKVCDKPCAKIRKIVYAQNKDGSHYCYPLYYKKSCEHLRRFCGYDLEPCMLCNKYMPDAYFPLYQTWNTIGIGEMSQKTFYHTR